jgi:hypothetical protein
MRAADSVGAVVSMPAWAIVSAAGRKRLMRCCWSWTAIRREQIAVFRQAAAADASGRVLEDLLTSLAADGYKISGDIMKRAPRDYPAEHPRVGLLKYRSLIAGRELESDAVRDVGPVYDACERLRPLLGWLAGHTRAADCR